MKESESKKGKDPVPKELEGKVRERLFELQDAGYRAFHCKLMPTVNPETVIGVRTPELRKFARDFSKTSGSLDFLNLLPHQYYEENNLHGMLIESIKDYEEVIRRLDAFLPYVDNWATCDLISPKIFRKHLPELLEQIRKWMDSGHVYTVRFGIGMLMAHYLGEAFEPEYLEWVAAVKSEEYYVNMMIAWFFATALAKQYAAAVPYIEKRRLEPWTHNKAIQKAIESNRIAPQQKVYLRSLKEKTPKKGQTDSAC